MILTYIAYYCGTLRVLLYSISLKSLEKYNKKLSYELLMLFVYLLRLLCQTYEAWT